ncbi:MAG: tetratricopeptide repeat protein [Candidatus Heimdallarchaeota archaeon]|nr:tetratricopeptide repeat protein [Candidatus Heimdallarchaeota archaeon]
MEEIREIEGSHTLTERQFAVLMIKKAFVQKQLGFFEKAKSLAQHTINLFGETILSLDEKYDLFIIIIETLWQLGEFEESLLLIERIENKIKNDEKNVPLELQNKIDALIFLNKSSIYSFIDLKKSEVFIERTLEFTEEIDDEILYAQSLFRKGKILTFQGQILEAIEVLEQSLDIGRKLNHYIVMADALVAIGEIHRLRGDFGKALQFYNTALILHQEIGNIFGMAVIYNNVGIVYYSKGDYDNSFEYFTKSLKRALEINFKFTVVESLFYLINILVSKDQLFEAKEHLQVSKDTSVDQTETMISYYSLLSEVVLLRTDNRFTSLGKAHDILREIISKNLVYHEINIHAMLNLCEILLHELRFSGKTEVLADLGGLTDNLLEIAEEQFSHSLLAEVYWLKGRLALVDADLDKARGFLSTAQSIAEGQDLENLARKISSDHDNLLNELNIWKNLIEEEASLADRIQESKIDKLVANMINRATFDLQEIENDTPVMLILLNEGGVPLFSQQFGTGKKVNQILLSGFLSAINNIVQEVFSTKGSLRRIEHQNYLLIFQNIENIIVCYAFKGSSFSARKKLNYFTKQIETSSFKEDFMFSSSTGKVLEDEKYELLEKWATEIFEMQI